MIKLVLKPRNDQSERLEVDQNHQLSLKKNFMKPSHRTGMGAIPFYDHHEYGFGVTFRVWAPHADQVHVAGSFNDWSDQRHPLFSEGNGYWSVDVYFAKIGDQYKYVITTSWGNQIWRTDPYGKKVHDSSTWNAEVVSTDFHWGNDHFQMPPWNELVIYEMHLASFHFDIDEPSQYPQLLEKLDYLQELGVNAILLLPIFAYQGEQSMGYNPALPFDIEDHYGGPEEAKLFVKEVHKRGMAVLLDIVFNHFGPQDLEHCLWQFDGWSRDGKGGIYFYNDWRAYTPYGENNRPDYSRPEVRQFLKDNIVMWMEEYRVDGFRFDSTVNIRNVYGKNDDPENDLPEGWQLLQEINNEIDQRMPWKISIAEDLQNNDWITEATSRGGAGFDTQWNNHFFWSIEHTLTALYDHERNMEMAKEGILMRGDALTKNVIYINNHDQCAKINGKHRMPDRIWRGNAESWHAKKKTTMATCLLFCTQGIPMIFQGDEFYEWGSWDEKKSIDWEKRAYFGGIIDLHKNLIALRRNIYNHSRGLRGDFTKVFHTNHKEKLIAFHRWEKGGAGDDVIVVANFSTHSHDAYQIGFPTSGKWKVRLNSDWEGYDHSFSNVHSNDVTPHLGEYDGYPFHGYVGIGPYTVVILSQDSR